MDVLSYACRDTAALAQSRKHFHSENNPQNVVQMHNNGIAALPAEVDDLPNPFGELSIYLTETELRETAYEILIGACRSPGASRPLTYVSNSQRKTERSESMSSSSSPSLQRSVASAAASKVKKALGLKSRKKVLDSDSAAGQKKRASTVGELMRVQMKVSEQTDSRVRRAMLRVAAGQLGKRIESMVLSLELLQHFKSLDFPSQLEYEAWQKRNLKVLEAGLLLHPHLSLNKGNTTAQQLRQFLHEAYEKPIETGKHSESVRVLRSLVISLACRSFDGSVSEMCHWADGVPLNLRLYQILLEACFDVNEDTLVIEEVDEVLELIKKTWTVLGINQNFHNLCFAWVLFYRYVTTGQVENDLLLAAVNLLVQVEKDTKATEGSDYWKILASTLSLVLDWAEKRLRSYHDSFYRGNIDIMQSVLSLGITAAKTLDASCEHGGKWKEADIACRRIDSYIRSSLHKAFSQEKEKLLSGRKSAKNQQNSLPMLSMLAQNIADLAFNEREIYSPILKQWHPLATGVAAATLHACYRKELKHFITSITELTPDSAQVLIASDKLEKDLVQMAVADAVDSDDGGKAIISEMTPFEAEAVIAKLVKTWINTRVDRLKEWVERNLQQEVWNPRANKERFAPSAVEVLRIMDETLEAFFLLPIPMHQDLIPELMNGLDRCLQNYILKAKSGCGSKGSFIPAMPSLTRCAGGSKFGVFKKKERSHMVPPRKSQVGGTAGMENASGVPQLCTRINTMHLIRKELEILEKRIMTNLTNAGYIHDSNITNGSGKMFELSASACVEGIQQLSESTAYKIVFSDLSHVLWECLYIGEVASFRIEPVLQELEQNLVTVSATVHDRVRTRVITDIMKASFHGFLLVLLAGGPARVFTLQDAAIVDEDFKFLVDLFWSDGDGLPIDLIDKYSTAVKDVLWLFHTDTENLIEQLKCVTLDKYGVSEKSRLPLPPTSGQWSASEPDTILRVLCHRNDVTASKFLKKTYNLPKKL